MNRFYLSLLLLSGCSFADRSEPKSAPVEQGFAADEVASAEPKMEKERSALAKKRPAKSAASNVPAAAPGRMKGDKAEGAGGESAPMELDGDDASEAQVETRAWFPETFLFEPIIETDESGQAHVDVTVPDQLTTWRVLALAHDRGGRQAGTVVSFQGTLPIYLDLILPPVLLVGDEAKIPVQVVNTTDQTKQTTLIVEMDGLELTGAARLPITLPPFASRVEYLSTRARTAGQARIKAKLSGLDAVEKTLEITSKGRPVLIEASGTLAAPRKVELDVPAGHEPDSANVRLRVFPGALAVLRAELASASYRRGPAEDAYALLLSGIGPALLERLGETPDADAQRKTALIGAQRAIHHTRSPDAPLASLFAEAALSHPKNPILSRMGERLSSFVAAAQRPDGTFGGGSGWTLQRVLVATAEGVRAVTTVGEGARQKQRAEGAKIRASSAFERNVGRVKDGYTAAAILSTGVVTGSLKDRLLEVLEKDLVARDDGSRVLAVKRGVVRSDGRVPTENEATALAVLALEGSDKAQDIVLDLGAHLLGAYRPGSGWGDGRTNLWCLRAVTRLFKDPVPERIEVTLAMDGQPVVSDVLEGKKRKQTTLLEARAPNLGGKHEWSMRAEPAVPGLGYALTIEVFVPWPEPPKDRGVELNVTVPDSLRVGRSHLVELSAAAPAGRPFEIHHALPAGVQPQRPSLERLVEAGTIRGFHIEDGLVRIEGPALDPGQAWSAAYSIVPTLRGKLYAPASRIEIQGGTFDLPPELWEIR